jgi:hypothetical protein
MGKTWIHDPPSGGVKIPKSVQERTRTRILVFAQTHYSGKYIRIEVRFCGALCHVDAYTEPDFLSTFDPKVHGESREERIERLRNTPTHLCRLRYFRNEDRWSMAFFTYSNMRYKLSVFNNFTFFGTPEEAFETSAIYLQG